jgi:hypothetical protein
MNNTEEQSSDTSKTSGSVWEQWIRKVRDNIVLISGTLYVLGYIVWSLNAAMNNMGLLPALDFQYFVAGIIPALLIYLTYHFIKLTLKTIERLRNWLYSEEQMSKEKLLVRRGVISLFYILDIGGLIYIYIFGEPSIALLYIFAPFMILLLIIVIGITPSKEVADIRHPFVKAVYQMFSHFYPIMLILSLAIMALTLYAFVWYPSVLTWT